MYFSTKSILKNNHTFLNRFICFESYFELDHKLDHWFDSQVKMKMNGIG